MSDYQLPSYVELDRLDRGYLELQFDAPLDAAEQVLANIVLTKIYGTWSEMDWRDDQTCWVWIGKNK